MLVTVFWTQDLPLSYVCYSEFILPSTLFVEPKTDETVCFVFSVYDFLPHSILPIDLNQSTFPREDDLQVYF